MKTIVIASQKGGVGKTTIAAHLAVAAGLRGQLCALLDTDPQQSLTEWWQERKSETPALISVTDLNQLAAIKQQCDEDGVKLLIVDTPPAYADLIAKAVAVADLVVIPCRPSPHDLRAVGATVALAEKLNAPFVFVLNSINPRANVSGEAFALLASHGEVVPQSLGNRTSFATSATHGQTVLETEPKSPGAEEMLRLADYILGRLKRRK